MESHPRSMVKAVSWRILGSIDTFVLSWLFSGNPTIAVSIAGTEVFTKILLFYFHERIWALVHWGHIMPEGMGQNGENDVPADPEAAASETPAN
ncbi:DUF2061 domain-containing protein [Stakelama marina]|uniref:DUF2061 domain-containing protein n=1 Tax=Stakelama marina TaxID=2826939 RepID=UPI0024C2A499|nr:DUF2061 domain-containing protein [Stakelama marina]